MGLSAALYFETESDLRIAQSGLNRETVRRPDTVAKNIFHGTPQIAPHMVQMTRDAGFMLPSRRPISASVFFLGVIEAEPLLFLWFEAFERRLQCPRE